MSYWTRVYCNDCEFLLMNCTCKKDEDVKMKYRKKPVVIDAIKLGWDTWSEICDFVTPEYFEKGVYINADNVILPDGEVSDRMGLIIKTLEGNHLAIEGDFIIRGVKGEFYPCKPDIFDLTYEKVESGRD